MEYKEYLGEIPHNTLVTWYSDISRNIPFTLMGWTGIPKEPFRHWAAYPKLEDYQVLQDIWKHVNEIFIDEGLNLTPERVIINQFNHGDSSWVHKDCEQDNAWTVVIYMTPYWDLNWGGDTIIIKDNEIVKCAAATPGKIFLFKSNLIHGARPVSREAPIPRTGLVFQCVNNIQKFENSKISSISSKI